MKFTDEDLQKLLDQNLPKAEIAHKLGVTKETVRYRTNQLKSKQKYIDPEILNLETETERIDCKSALTLQEQIFLDLHLIEKKAIKDAMIKAGYQNLPDRTIYFRAKKILQKYEAKVGDHRKIMRAMGYGETGILQMLIDSAENAKSEIVRLNARIVLAKCLGLQKEVIEGREGVTVIIQGIQDQGQPAKPVLSAPPALPGPQPYNHPQPSAPGKPIQIYK
jgi:DNA-binding Lrp family transcriptional regulator